MLFKFLQEKLKIQRLNIFSFIKLICIHLRVDISVVTSLENILHLSKALNKIFEYLKEKTYKKLQNYTQIFLVK